MPHTDLIGPPSDSVPESEDLDEQDGVGEITDDLSDLEIGGVDIGMVIDLTDQVLRVPLEPQFMSWVSSGKQTEPTIVLIIGQWFSRDRLPRRARKSGSSQRPRCPHSSFCG
jgi:hypothetical protein